jgi:adenylate kinase
MVECKKRRIILFGAPGSGKGTQAEMLKEYLKVKRISLGDLLREEVKNNTELGEKVKGYMEKGLLVPDEIVSSVIEKNIDKDGFILDGYPRNINQAITLDSVLEKKESRIDLFIYLDVDEDTVIKRLSKRRVCKECGANYHLENMPPKTDNKCDICGAELIQRKDDTPQVIKERWRVFSEESKKLLEFYAERNKLVKVDGSKSKEEVFEKIKNELLH